MRSTHFAGDRSRHPSLTAARHPALFHSNQIRASSLPPPTNPKKVGFRLRCFVEITRDGPYCFTGRSSRCRNAAMPQWRLGLSSDALDWVRGTELHRSTHRSMSHSLTPPRLQGRIAVPERTYHTNSDLPCSRTL